MTVDEALAHVVDCHRCALDNDESWPVERLEVCTLALYEEVCRLRDALAAMNAIAISRAQLLRADTTGIAQQSAKLARVGALLARWNKNALERPTALSAPLQLADALREE